MAALLGYPLVDFFARSLSAPEGPLHYYALLVTNEYSRSVLATTFQIAFLTAATTTLLAYPVALLIASVRPSVARILILLVLIPFWTSILVRSYAWIVLLGREGVLNTVLGSVGLVSEPLSLLFNLSGVLIAMVHILLPYSVLTLLSVMTRLDRQLLIAASSLGAGAWQSFRFVLLPLTVPGIVGGFVLVFTLALGFFVTPALLGGRKEVMVAMLIHDEVARRLAWGEAAATGFVLLASILAVLWVSLRVLRLDRVLAPEPA